jgi:hypothetical protein
MNSKNQTVISRDPAFVEGIEALCDNTAGLDPGKDLTLCSVCMQWSCDGPHCHRPNVCDLQNTTV